MSTPFLHVSILGEQKLIAIDSVREILPMMLLHEVPPEPGADGFRGFANVRGTLVPVYSTSRTPELSADSFIIVFEERARLWGRVVDEVQDIVHIPNDRLSEAPLDDGGRARAARMGDDVVGILNPSLASGL